MASYAQSVIDQVLFQGMQAVNFPNIVREIRSRLDAMTDRPWLVDWDDEDVVTFDQPCMRVLLAWSDHAAPGLSGVLTLSAGPSPMVGKICMRPDFAEMAALLFSDIVAGAQGAKSVRHNMSCTMSAEWVSLLIDALPDMADGSTDEAACPISSDWKQLAGFNSSAQRISVKVALRRII
jgi:hypothetical protein